MQAVREVSPQALAVHAEAGIRARALEEALNEHDLTLGCALLPDVSPKLGGLLGGYGWGEPGAASGDIHDACIGLEAVLPRGQPIRIKPAPRRAAGPDLMQALLGGEGAFGIITAAWLRVQRTPRTRLLLGRWVPDTAAAVGLLAGLLADSVRPTLARIVRPGPAWATTAMHGEAGIVLVFEGEGSVVECFHDLASERVAAAGGEEMAEADPLRSRSPIEMPAEPERGVERIEAAGRWTELLALDREAATLFGDDLVSCRLSHALPEGGVATWTVAAAESRTLAERRPAFRFIGRLVERNAVLRAYRGPAAIPPRLLRRAQADLRPWMEALKKDLDPAGISNPGALGLP
jgi:alkyldihydroxyacetonephosphate synthase